VILADGNFKSSAGTPFKCCNTWKISGYRIIRVYTFMLKCLLYFWHSAQD